MIQTYYNSMSAVPVLLVLAIVFEQNKVLSYDRYGEFGFWKIFFFSATLGVFLSTFINLNNTVNSPMTTAITGEVKNIAGTFMGFLFGDVILTRNLAIGLSLSFLGAFVYTYNKAKNMMQAKKDT